MSIANVLSWDTTPLGGTTTKEDKALESPFYPSDISESLSQSDGNAAVLSTIQSVIAVATTALTFSGHMELVGALYGVDGLIRAFSPLQDAGVDALKLSYEIKAKLAVLPGEIKTKVQEVEIEKHCAKMETVHEWLSSHATVLRSLRPEDCKVLDKHLESLERCVDGTRDDSLPNHINQLLKLITWDSGSIGRAVLLDAASLLFTTHSHIARMYSARAAQYAQAKNIDSAKSEQGLFFDNLSSMEFVLQKTIVKFKAKFEEIAAWRVLQFQISNYKVSNLGERFIGWLSTAVGGTHDTRVEEYVYKYTVKDTFSQKEESDEILFHDSDSNEVVNTRRTEFEKQVQAKYNGKLKDHVRRAFANTSLVFAAWEKELASAAKILCPQPPAGEPVIQTEYRSVSAIADALKDAVSVSYAYKLTARRSHSTSTDSVKMESSLSAWTKPQALKNDNKLPVLVVDDQEFYLQTIREIYRKAEYPPGLQKPDAGKPVMVDRFPGLGKMEWVDDVKATPHGKD